MSEPAIAFFDVDGTLINTRSLLSFLDYFGQVGELERRPAFRRYCTELQDLISSGAPRARLNSSYYTLFAGESVADVERLGREWFALMCARPGFFNQVVVAELHRHKAAGVEVVLITGSFAALMTPLAEWLGCDAVLCTELEIEGSRYTGGLRRGPCIAEGKVAALRRYIEGRGVSLDRCVAYSDDETDYALLTLVGQGHVVQVAPAYGQELAQWASRRAAVAS